MKKKLKWVYWLIAILAFIILLCFALLIPPISNKVGEMVGVAGSKIRSVVSTIASAAIGLLLCSFGVTALAAVPVVGVILLVVGLALLAWSVWPLFSDSAPVNNGGSGLENMGTR
jgi:hypothetical protein